MTKQQYEAMEPFKAQFALAKTNFVRISRSDLDIIRRTYNDVFKKNLQVSNMNCNSCVIKMMKAMGCDAIRTSHNMPSQMQMDVCDSLGMMVMAESFDMWKNAVENEGNSNVPEQSEA